MASGDLVTRRYSDFLGVDFSNNNVSAYRSPESINIWKNYKELGKCISSRPGLKEMYKLDGKIYGMHFLKVANIQHCIVHVDTKLIDINMRDNTKRTIKEIGMNPFKSQSFIFNSILYIKDGLKYYQYDGSNLKEVEGYIPETSIARKPEGGGKPFLPINLLTPYRKNGFVSDGKSTDYYLDVPSFRTGSVSVVVNGSIVSNFTEHPQQGFITFQKAPAATYTDGEENVIITFAKDVEGHRNRIEKCNVLEVFDNHIFFAGNEDYPNTLFYSELNDPTYIPDNSALQEGMDGALIKALSAGGGKLWVFKEPTQSQQSIFYHVPSIMGANALNTKTEADKGTEVDYTADVQYPSQHSNISLGCISTAVNFNDDICFFSDYGLEGITSSTINDMEQITGHRSSLIDSKMLQENNYKNPIIAEWQGYLLIFIDNHCYLADSRQQWNNITHNEYEWYYWDFKEKISYATVLNDKIYICFENGAISTFSGEPDEEFLSYWSTCKDFFENPVSQKVTNKKGSILNLDGEKVKIYTRIDNKEWEVINEYLNIKGYIVPKIKKKKWKTIQFKFESDKTLRLYDFTVQCYVGGYVKR